MNLNVRNPHSVLAALETRPKDVVQIISPPSVLEREGEGSPGAQGRDAWIKVVSVARSKGIPISQSVREGGGGGRDRDSHRLGKAVPVRSALGEAGRVGAAEAILRERPGISAEELFRGAKERAGGKGLWLALDSLTDPHNVGAIFRTASFFGVQGILMTQERSSPLTAAVYDVASGGVEHVPFTLQTNLQRGFEIAKEAGLWVLGTSEHAQQSFRKIERDRPWLLVLGNEEKGMRRLTEEACDVTCQVPPQGGVSSLNVSVAAGVLIAALSG